MMQELTCKTELAAYVSRMAVKLPKGRAVLNTSNKKQTVQHVLRIKTFWDGVTKAVNWINQMRRELFIVSVKMNSHHFLIRGKRTFSPIGINCILTEFWSQIHSLEQSLNNNYLLHIVVIYAVVHQTKMFVSIQLNSNSIALVKTC